MRHANEFKVPVERREGAHLGPRRSGTLQALSSKCVKAHHMRSKIVFRQIQANA